MGNLDQGDPVGAEGTESGKLEEFQAESSTVGRPSAIAPQNVHIGAQDLGVRIPIVAPAVSNRSALAQKPVTQDEAKAVSAFDEGLKDEKGLRFPNLDAAVLREWVTGFLGYRTAFTPNELKALSSECDDALLHHRDLRYNSGVLPYDMVVHVRDAVQEAAANRQRTTKESLQKGAELAEEFAKTGIDALRSEYAKPHASGFRRAPNRSEEYFDIGQGMPNGFLAKYYINLDTKSENVREFVRRLAEWADSQPGMSMHGKIWADVVSSDQRGTGIPGAHNSVIFYVPFSEMGRVNQFLGSVKSMINQIELNHPFGVEIFPGVSALIDQNKPSGEGFDRPVGHAFKISGFNNQSIINVLENSLLKVDERTQFLLLLEHMGRLQL